MLVQLKKLWVVWVSLFISSGIVLLFAHFAFASDDGTTPGTTRAVVTWDANEPAPEGYRIYKRTEGTPYDYNQPSWEGPDCSGAVYDLNRGTTYYFVVRAFEGEDESLDSVEVSFLAPSPPQAEEYEFFMSVSPDRSQPVALAGATLEADIYAFVEPIDGIQRVEFFLDGELRRIERAAPYDFAGGGVDAASMALPFDTGVLDPGTHTFSARITKTEGSVETIAADVTVLAGEESGDTPDSEPGVVIPPSPQPVIYTVVASAIDHGTISPAGMVQIEEGAGQNFTITADVGYHISDVVVDGVSKGSISSYSFNDVMANHTIDVNFDVDSYTITASSEANGTISSQGPVLVNHGSDQSYFITPDNGYQISDVLVDDISMGGIDTYTFHNVVADHRIQAIFVKQSYEINAGSGANGSISPPGIMDVFHGNDQVFTFHADEGFHVEDVVVDGQSLGTMQSYTFSSIEHAHTIFVSFSENELAVIRIEAEDGDLHWPMEIADDSNAGNGGYVWVPSGENDTETAEPGYSEYFFEIPEAGDYYIWGRQQSVDIDSDSFIISLDGSEEMVWHTKISGPDEWNWDVVSKREADDPRDRSNPDRFRLTAGQHTLKIKQGDVGTKLDQLIITNNSSFTVYELLVSVSPDRANPEILAGATVEGDIYAFIEPIDGIQKVEFFLDGELMRIERAAPYDFAGGGADAASMAVPFDTSALDPGIHTFSARITRTEGFTETIVADVHVDDGAYKQWFSVSPDRANPEILAGATVEGNIYAFIEPIDGIQRVEFFLDGELRRIERAAPYDFAGGGVDAASMALPFNTGVLDPGTHTFSARITKTEGSVETIAADVTVGAGL